MGQVICARFRGMPDLSSAQAILAATIFLYPTVEAAEAGEQFGGSGLLVGVPFDHRPDLIAMYAVTNWHVACSGGHSIIRYTDSEGRIQIVETDPTEWEFIPGGPDIAACLFRENEGHHCRVVNVNMFASDDENDIFIGEDVFMAGRFVNFDGKETNRPALRFGAISMLNAPVQQPTGSMSPSHIVDMHSRTGYSGSPVYAYRPQGRINKSSQLYDGVVIGSNFGDITRRTWGDGTQLLLKLLGLQWGQFPELWELKSGVTRPKEEATLITAGKYVQGFSGMSCVIPAHAIKTLLDQPALKQIRSMDPGHFVSIPVPEGWTGKVYNRGGTKDG